MKILLIGGCGYIGSALYSKLTERGLSVSSVDLEWFGNSGLDNLNTDYSNISPIWLSQFDTVVLLAGHSSAKMCENNPVSAHYNNVVNFVNLLSKLNNTQKLIYASSSSVYGNVSVQDVNEEYMDYKPVGYYDLTKKEIDLYARLSNIEYYGLRFGTVCGASPNWRNDIMLNAMYDKYMQNKEILLFNKAVWRPILGMNDLTSAIIKIIESKTDNRGLYNLASFNLTAENIAYSMGEFLSCPVRVIENTQEIINTKLQSNSYNYTINCDKFSSTFNFSFGEDIKSIVESLKSNCDSCMRSNRSDIKPYKLEN